MDQLKEGMRRHGEPGAPTWVGRGVLRFGPKYQGITHLILRSACSFLVSGLNVKDFR